MKKNFIWMFAAALTCGMAFTSCANQDSPTPWNDPDSGWGNYNYTSSTVVNFEDEASAAVFTPNKLNYEIVTDETEENGTKVAKFTYAGKGYCFATYAFKDLETSTKVSVSYDFCFPASISGQAAISLGDAYVQNIETGGFNTGTPQYGFGSNGAIFYLGASRGKVNGANQNYFWVNGTPVASTVSEEGRKADDMWGKWFHVDMNVDVTAKTLDFVVSRNDEVWFEAKDSAFISPNAATCTQLGVFLGNSGSILLDNINVTTASGDPDAEYADYTISYVDTEGAAIPEDLKATITRRGKVGEAITLLDTDKANFTNADGSVKYTYQSDNSEGAKITAAGTEIKIVYKSEVVPKYQYIFNCMIEGQTGADAILAQFKGEEFEGKKTYVRLPIAFYKNNKCYVTTPSTYNGKEVSVDGTEAKTQGFILTTVNYALNEDWVYFADCEDMEIVGETVNGYSFGTFNRVSQGKHIRLNVGTSMTTKDAIATAGTYDIALYGRSDSGTSYPVTLYVVAADGTETKAEAATPESYGSASMGWFTFASVTVPAGAKLKFVNESTWNGFGYDCLKVTKIAAAE